MKSRTGNNPSDSEVRVLISQLLVEGGKSNRGSKLRAVERLVSVADRPEVASAFESLVASDATPSLKLATLRKLAASATPAVSHVGKVGLSVDQHTSVRVAAADLLSEMDDDESLDALRRCLHDRVDSVVVHSANALGARGDRASEPELVGLLSRSRITVRVAAAKALAEVGTNASLEPLQKLAATERWPYRLIVKAAASNLAHRLSQ